MSITDVSTRRSFMRTAGAALSAPLAAAAPAAAKTPAPADPLSVRLARLEDTEAIRALNQAFARHVSAGAREELAGLFADGIDVSFEEPASALAALRDLSAVGFGEQDLIDVASDRLSATGRVPCTARLETPIGPDCPLVEMARAQGGGVVTRVEAGVFEHVYVRRAGIWKIRRSTYAKDGVRS